MSALEACDLRMVHTEALVGRDRSDNRCPTDSCFLDALYRLEDVLNSTSTKQAVSASFCAESHSAADGVETEAPTGGLAWRSRGLQL